MRYVSIGSAAHDSIIVLKRRGEKVDAGHWQGVKTGGRPDLVTQEYLNLSFECPIPAGAQSLANELTVYEDHHLNLPWVEDHFQERVSRDPSNPGVEFANWPHWKGQVEATQTYHEGRKLQFTHTYQERFWPKAAGDSVGGRNWDEGETNTGIRYEYGDLDDVIDLLRREPHTRQATFPIFFPEDTGAVHGGRIPCTLHYHFLLRDHRLHLWYAIRSCDAYRHFYDDLYMACRLCHFVLSELVEREMRSDAPQTWVDVDPGTLYFTAYSFHVHMGDRHLL